MAALPPSAATTLKYRFGRSAVHEWGLFAAAPLAAGEHVIEYTGELVGNAVCDARERRYQAQGTDNYLFRLDASWVVDATRAGNAARFVNHSCAPNCRSRVLPGGPAGRGRVVIEALRDVAAGEELTYDYKFDIEPDANGKKIACRCGAPTCRGTMN